MLRCIALVLLLLLAAEIFAGEGSVSGESRVRLMFLLEKKQYKVDEKIVAKIVLENQTQIAQGYTYTTLFRNHAFSIWRGESKREVQKTSYGTILAEVVVMKAKELQRKLQPGEKYTIEIDDLRRVYDLTLAGKYSLAISATHADNSGVDLKYKAEPVEFEIIADETKFIRSETQGK